MSRLGTALLIGAAFFLARPAAAVPSWADLLPVARVGAPLTPMRDTSRMLLERGIPASSGNLAVVSLALVGMAVEVLAGDAAPALAPCDTAPVASNPLKRLPRSLSSRGTRSLLGRAIVRLKRPTRRAPRAAVPLRDECGSAPTSADEVVWGGALNAYLALVHRAAAPYARVTSTFDEPRPGRLHHGYDIGLDAGTAVPVGWAGRVTSLTPWYNGEMCITVRVGDVDVNYGHLVPVVTVDQEVRVGDVVGHVAYNHVDIKMLRGEDYIDWGKVDPFLQLGRERVQQETHAFASPRALLSAR